jgi:hypothetical protein
MLAIQPSIQSTNYTGKGKLPKAEPSLYVKKILPTDKPQPQTPKSTTEECVKTVVSAVTWGGLILGFIGAACVGLYNSIKNPKIPNSEPKIEIPVKITDKALKMTKNFR